MHLQVDETAQPVVMPPHRIPPALRDKFKGELNRLENLRVLSKVDEPTSWVSSIVVRTKRSGQLRVCIDPRHLNRALKRETYQLPLLNDLLPELSSIFDRGPHQEILALRARLGIKAPFTLQKIFGTARIKMARVPQKKVRLG